MRKCSEECTPCCDYCQYVVHEVIEFESGKGIGGPIFCKLHLDEELEDQQKGAAIVRTFGV